MYNEVIAIQTVSFWRHCAYTYTYTYTYTYIHCKPKNQYTWLLVITLANVDKFTKLFHCQIPEVILYTNVIKIIYLTLIMFLHYPVKLQYCNCCWFQWHIACKTSCKIWCRLYSPGVNPIKSGKQCSSASGGSMMSANWSSGWLTCNMGCSRQSLMKLAPVNGANVCQLVFVYEMGVFSSCFDFQTIYQVGWLQ